MSDTLRRIRQELAIIGPIYGASQHDRDRVSFDTKNGSWVCVKNLPIPKILTRDGQGLVDILLLVPPAYPNVPPDGFYCDQNLKLVGHYFQGWTDKYYPTWQKTLIEQGWNWYCMHASKVAGNQTWRPSADASRGDNLLTYLHLCLAILGKEGKKA